MSTSSSANKCKEYVIIISGVVICKLFLEWSPMYHFIT
jgi:hypothetical protein